MIKSYSSLKKPHRILPLAGKKKTNLVGHHVGVQDAFDAILSHLEIDRHQKPRVFRQRNGGYS